MDVNPSVEAGSLRVAGNDRTERAAREADGRHGRVLYLDRWVIEIAEEPGYLSNGAHEPQEQVELMDRLVDQDSTTFAVPAPTPGIHSVISVVPPSEHVRDSQNGAPNSTSFDG